MITMLKRFLFVACCFVCLGVTAAEITSDFASTPLTTEFAITPEVMHLARAIVGEMVVNKLPDEILAMVYEIALALSEKDLCGIEDIVAMMEVGIPFDNAYDAVVKACNIQGAELAALNRSLSPGLTVTGGVGPEVSP